MRHTILLIFYIIFFLLGSQAQVLNMKDYINGKDATLGVIEAIKICKKTKITKIVFPNGKYEFWPVYASEKYVYTSNNDEGSKRIVFDLSGLKNLEIDGQGSEFIFHGYVCPFVLENSQNIKLKNFSIDYSRTFHSEGVIVATYTDSMDVWFAPSYPYTVANSRLKFIDEDKTSYPFKHLLEFDINKRETAFMVRDIYYSGDMITKDLGDGNVRLYRNDIKGTVGNVMTFNADKRSCSAFAISKSTNVDLSDIAIYHCGGMGVIAQQTKNISLNRLKVTPTPGSGRMISLTADATHFVNCSGKITMIDCLFENQLDDATNVHGIYVRIEKIISPNSVLVKLVHPQQRGFDFLYPNTKVEITNRKSLMPYCNNVVEEVERYNEEYTRVVFKESMPEKVEPGDVIASIEEYPEVVIKGCTIHNNRARGVLLGSRNKIMIENNYFNTQGAAILLEGDAKLWFEQCGVRNLIVKGNTFDNCNYNLWGSGVITVMSGIEGKFREESKYNQNILIENNIFKLCAPNILYLYSVDGLIYRNNKVEQSTMYSTPWKVKETFVTPQCTNIIIKE